MPYNNTDESARLSIEVSLKQAILAAAGSVYTIHRPDVITYATAAGRHVAMLVAHGPSQFPPSEDDPASIVALHAGIALEWHALHSTRYKILARSSDWAHRRMALSDLLALVQDEVDGHLRGELEGREGKRGWVEEGKEVVVEKREG